MMKSFYKKKYWNDSWAPFGKFGHNNKKSLFFWAFWAQNPAKPEELTRAGLTPL